MTKAGKELNKTGDACAESGPPAVEENRRPYESPSVRSGEAFEHVMLESGCNSALFCSVPC